MNAPPSALVLPRAMFPWGLGRETDAAPRRIAGLNRAFVIVVVFIAGWYLPLPVTDLIDLPWWAAKITVGPNVQVFEVIFAGYLLVGGLVVLWRRALKAGYLTLPVSVLLIVLAAWCAIISLLGPLPGHDAGRSARLILLATLLLAVTHWAANDPLLVLRTFMLGLVGGSIANLVLTYLNPVLVVAGALPRLLGQNLPAPPMGIAVCLSAWLILLSRNRRDTIFALTVAAICGAGAMISYSKTGMLAAGMGFLSIAVVSGRVAVAPRGRVLLVVGFAALLAGANFLRSAAGERLWGAFSGMLQEKVESASSASSSVRERWSYFLGVSEIVATHPLGVGYSGFRGAMMKTEAYASGMAADESEIAADASNPHSLFLYYASAGGLIGAALAVAIFVLTCVALLRGLGLYGASGLMLALCCCTAYGVLAISVPYVFNSAVMLIPVAIAAGIHAHVRRAVGVAAPPPAVVT